MVICKFDFAGACLVACFLKTLQNYKQRELLKQTHTKGVWVQRWKKCENVCETSKQLRRKLVCVEGRKEGRKEQTRNRREKGRNGRNMNGKKRRGGRMKDGREIG